MKKISLKELFEEDLQGGDLRTAQGIVRDILSDYGAEIRYEKPYDGDGYGQSEVVGAPSFETILEDEYIQALNLSDEDLFRLEVFFDSEVDEIAMSNADSEDYPGFRPGQ